MIGAAALVGAIAVNGIWDDRSKPAGHSIAKQAATTEQDPQASCASRSTYDGLKNEIFRRAGSIRRDNGAYARLSDVAVVRFERPMVRRVDHEVHSVSCSGTAFISLPPAIADSAGGGNLSGDVDYIVQSAADGSGSGVRLDNDNGLSSQLAKSPAWAWAEGGGSATRAAAVGNPMPVPAKAQARSDSETAPSYECRGAKSNSQAAVCSDRELAALDRDQALQYKHATEVADASQGRVLELTRIRFLSRRDQCASNECIADAYRSRMREIGEIMAGRWRG